MFKLNTQIMNKVSLFDMAKFMPYSDMYDLLDSTFIKAIKKIRNYGIYPVTVEENNPALISERIYGLYNTEYWWILMIYNDLIDVTDVKNGMTIKYPRVADLQQLYFQLTPNSLIKTR